MLFCTYANAKYHAFATLYPLFALISNPYASVEILLSDYKFFANYYRNVIEFYKKVYPDKVRYTPVNIKGILPNSVRFLLEPTKRAKYVYIGDIDIFLLDENILDYHLAFMERHNSDFSNVLRNEHQLTGLHFIPFDKMYPISIPNNLDLLRLNDEVLLCHMMREKKLRFPVDAELNERKIHGLHISFFSRPPLTSMTTFDEFVNFPSWGPLEQVEKYLRVRYTEPVKNFIKCLSPYQIGLRKIIQFVDMWAFFVKEHPNTTLIA